MKIYLNILKFKVVFIVLPYFMFLLCSQGIHAKPIHFGLSADLSGPNKTVGESVMIGLESAFAEANRAQPHHIFKLHYLDDKNRPLQNNTNINKLADDSKNLAIITASNGKSALRIAQRTKILFFAATDGSTILHSNEKNRYTINHKINYEQELAYLALSLRKSGINTREIAMLNQEDTYSSQGLKQFTKALYKSKNKKTAEFASIKYQNDDASLSDAVKNLMKFKRDFKVIIILGNSKTAAKLIKTSKEHFPGAYYVLLSSTDNVAIYYELCAANAQLCKEFTQNVVLTSAIDHSNNSPAFNEQYRKSVSLYLEEYNKTNPEHNLRKPKFVEGMSTLEGYIIGRALVEAVKKIPKKTTINRESLIDALYTLVQIKDRKIRLGIRGSITEDEMMDNFWLATMQSQHLNPFHWEKKLDFGYTKRYSEILKQD